MTSWNELRREALACDEWNLMNPDGQAAGPVRHAAAPRRARPGRGGQRLHARGARTRSRRGCPASALSLGTDGFGLSDTRAALRRHFNVDAQSIVVGVLTLLARRGEIAWEVVRQAHATYKLQDVQATTAEEAGGETELPAAGRDPSRPRPGG